MRTDVSGRTDLAQYDMHSMYYYGGVPVPGSVTETKGAAELQVRHGEADATLPDLSTLKITGEKNKESDAPSVYKTELCRQFTFSGSCTYGNSCQFAHGEHELRVRKRGKKYRTKKCKSFWEKGFCPYGARCCFLHEISDSCRPVLEDELTSASKSKSKPKLDKTLEKTELCRLFMNLGTCKYGEKCTFAHGEAERRPRKRSEHYKTKKCRAFWNLGFCKYGERCLFIHNEESGTTRIQ